MCVNLVIRCGFGLVWFKNGGDVNFDVFVFLLKKTARRKRFLRP